MKNRLHTTTDGYLVVIGGFLSTFIAGCLLRSTPLIYQQILETFGASASMVSLIFALSSCIGRASAWPSMEFSVRFGSRTALIAAGLIKGLSVIACGFSPSVYFLLVFYGIFQAFGTALIYSAEYWALCQHFSKNKGKANGITMAGLPIGGMAFAPLVQLLFETYGYEGCMLILAAISFNICVAGSIVRPGPDPATQEDENTSEENKSLLSLFRNIYFVLYLFHIIMQKIENSACFTFFTGIAREADLTHMQSAVIISIGSGFGLAGKIIGGFLYDLKPFRNKKTLLYATFAALCSVMTITTPIGNTYAILAFKHALHMFMVGAHTIHFPIITEELVGIENLTPSIGLTGLCSALGCFVGLTVGGEMKDRYESYSIVYYCGGGVGLLGGTVFLLSILIKHCKKTRNSSDS